MAQKRRRRSKVAQRKKTKQTTKQKKQCKPKKKQKESATKTTNWRVGGPARSKERRAVIPVRKGYSKKERPSNKKNGGKNQHAGGNLYRPPSDVVETSVKRTNQTNTR